MGRFIKTKFRLVYNTEGNITLLSPFGFESKRGQFIATSVLIQNA